MIENHIAPEIAVIMNGDLGYDVWYQHDGAPPHGTQPVRDLLQHLFGQHVIGNNYPVAWPARSPDLAPLDFFYGAILGVKYITA